MILSNNLLDVNIDYLLIIVKTNKKFAVITRAIALCIWLKAYFFVPL